jgi:lysophospholipase L1-like esterase
MKNIIIVAFGDSITNGVGIGDVTEEYTFRKLLEKDIKSMINVNARVINAGVNGDITTTAIERLDRDVLQHNPGYVTIMFGVNDAGYYRPDTDSMAETPRVFAKDFKANLIKIVDDIQMANSIPIMVTPLPMNDNYAHKNFHAYIKNGLNYIVDEYCQIIRELCHERNLYLIDVNKEFNQDPNTANLIPDGIHPNKCGHRYIADLYLSEFLKILDISDE